MVCPTCHLGVPNDQNLKTGKKNLNPKPKWFIFFQLPPKIIWGYPVTKICILCGPKMPKNWRKKIQKNSQHFVLPQIGGLQWPTFAYLGGQTICPCCYQYSSIEVSLFVLQHIHAFMSFTVTDLQSKYLYMHLDCRNRHAQKLRTMCKTCINLQSPRGVPCCRPPPPHELFIWKFSLVWEREVDDLLT